MSSPFSSLPPATHLVQPGDTLYAIAFRYELNHLDIARWNNIRNPDLIYAGQALRLRPPAITPNRPPPLAPIQIHRPSQLPVARSAPPSPPPVAAVPVPPPLPELPSQEIEGLIWTSPTEGTMRRGFDPNKPGGKGILLSGQRGQPVRAAAAGEVVYSGSGLPGYGRLIIIKHSDALLSAYGYLGDMRVRKGQTVQGGQHIAELGVDNENVPSLHFQVRKHGEAVDPTPYLPG